MLHGTRFRRPRPAPSHHQLNQEAPRLIVRPITSGSTSSSSATSRRTTESTTGAARACPSRQLTAAAAARPEHAAEDVGRSRRRCYSAARSGARCTGGSRRAAHYGDRLAARTRAIQHEYVAPWMLQIYGDANTSSGRGARRQSSSFAASSDEVARARPRGRVLTPMLAGILLAALAAGEPPLGAAQRSDASAAPHHRLSAETKRSLESQARHGILFVGDSPVRRIYVRAIL